MKELVEGARCVYQGPEFASQYEAAAKGWDEVRDDSKAQRKCNSKQAENFP